MKKLILIAVAAAALSACNEKVSFDTLETARTQAKANAEFNAQMYRSNNPQLSNTSIIAQTDSTMVADCPQGDGWASVKLVDKANPAAYLDLKCSTVSGAVGCLKSSEFISKPYAADDGRCQSQDKVPFPIPKIAK